MCQALPCPLDAVVRSQPASVRRRPQGTAALIRSGSSDVLLSILLVIIPLLLARTLGTASGKG